MAEILTCPPQEQLQALLEGRLSADEQPRVAEHIDQCASCQATLESIRLSGQSWVDVAPALVESGADSPALQEVLQRAKAGGTSATTDGASVPAEESWGFLQPSDNPDHLGRLDSYQILALIGKGGMGIVFRGFDEKLHRMVAIKVMAPQLATSAVARQRFIREARAAAAVSHDHVVPIYAVADEAPLPYLVMQLVGGQSLQEKLDRIGPLGLREILRIGMQTAEGLAAAHKQGLVHRDIKPANILLENGVERVKLTDFGLARTRDDASVTQSGMIAGTPQFMAPEQAAGEAVDYRADLFSLGSVLYAMCAGRAPFRASNAMAVLKRVCDETPTPIQQINPDIPDWLAEIIAKLQQKKPSERFQSAQEVADLLGQQLAEVQQPGPARRVTRLESSKDVASSGSAGTPFEDSGRATQAKWKSGDRVMAPWSDGWLYPARVHEVNGDSVFVWFDDGATAWVNAGEPRPLDIGKGSHVFDEWGYLVQVSQRDGDRIHIIYDDGTAEWTTLQHICMPVSKPPGAVVHFAYAGPPGLGRAMVLLLSIAFAVVFVFTRGAAGPDGSTTWIGAFDPWLVYETGPDGGSHSFNAVSWSFASGVLAVASFMLWRSLRPQKTTAPLNDSEGALARLRNASIGLFVTGILYWATVPILFAARFSGLMQPEHVPYLWWTLGVFPAIAGFVLIFGAWKMRHGEMYPACLLAAILPLGMLLEKLINFRDGRLAVSPGDVTALPFGMWALIVLTRNDVRAAFAANSARRGSPDPADLAERRSSTLAADAKGDLRSAESGGSGDPRRAPATGSRGASALLGGVGLGAVLVIAFLWLGGMRFLRDGVREPAQNLITSALAPVRLAAFDPAKHKPIAFMQGPEFVGAVGSGKVTVEKDSVRIDGLGGHFVKLFDLSGSLPADGEFSLRAQMKALDSKQNKVPVGSVGWLHLQDAAGGGAPGRFVLPAGAADDWNPFEVRYPVQPYSMGDTRVASVVIRVMESGTIWLKDVELWHIPALPAPPAVVGEVVLKRIDPKEKPFSVGGFFQGKISEDRWAFRSETLGRTVRLHVLEKPNADGDQLTLRARLLGGNDTGAGTCTGAHLQLVGHFAGGAVVTSAKPTLLLKGSTSWQSFQATLTVPKGLRLERVEMNLVMFPHAGESAMLDYFVAVKDIELVKSPPTGPPQPVVLRTFDPVKDKVLHGDAKTEEGGWRIKYDGNAHQGHVRLFRVADLTVPKEGKFIFRATLKAQRSPSFKSEFTFGVFLSMGPERLPFAPGSGARDVNSLEWTTYEVVYPTSKFKDIGATGLPLDLMVLGNGTVWVKDIELLYAPETK